LFFQKTSSTYLLSRPLDGVEETKLELHPPAAISDSMLHKLSSIVNFTGVN